MIFVYDFCTYVYGRQLLMYLPRMGAPLHLSDRHGRGSRGIIKLGSFRFFTRGLMPPTKFQRGLLFISDFLTYSLWRHTGKPVVPFITFHRCDIPVRRTRLWQACPTCCLAGVAPKQNFNGWFLANHPLASPWCSAWADRKRFRQNDIRNMKNSAYDWNYCWPLMGENSL